LGVRKRKRESVEQLNRHARGCTLAVERLLPAAVLKVADVTLLFLRDIDESVGSGPLLLGLLPLATPSPSGELCSDAAEPRDTAPVTLSLRASVDIATSHTQPSPCLQRTHQHTPIISLALRQLRFTRQQSMRGTHHTPHLMRRWMK
jgi:hypothetical protein